VTSISLDISVNTDILHKFYNSMEEVVMRYLIFVALLLVAAPVMATVGGGDITLKSKGGDVVFSHETHVSGAGQKCTSCHDNLYTNAKHHKKTSMKDMQKGKSCGACHNGKAAFSVKGDCAKCHKK
jgi:c(7)-type cytochrome triheme protein